jgi:hypothetical protein
VQEPWNEKVAQPQRRYNLRVLPSISAVRSHKCQTCLHVRPCQADSPVAGILRVKVLLALIVMTCSVPVMSVHVGVSSSDLPRYGRATLTQRREPIESDGNKNPGAEEGTRTPTPLRVHGPEPCASANSATSASGLLFARLPTGCLSGRTTLYFTDASAPVKPAANNKTQAWEVLRRKIELDLGNENEAGSSQQQAG